MKVLRMIDTLNVDGNVGVVEIGVNNNDQWNNEIIKTIMNKYSNIYAIGVFD